VTRRTTSRTTKPSGLGWAGDVPADWDVVKICLIAKLESGHTPSRQHPEYWVPSECTIPWFSLADVWQLREGTQDYLGETSECISPMGIAHSAARLLPAGTVVLSRTASVGFAGIMPRPMATTQDFANWVPGERVISEFLLYALRAMRGELDRAMMGSTHQTIYMPDIRRLAIPLPSRDEQIRIVAALRARLPKLDAAIAKKEQLLALMEEKRQALVTNAVTKGLDPRIKTRPSGVHWIGQIPAHWTIKRTRHVCALTTGWRVTQDANYDGAYPFFVRSDRVERIDTYSFDGEGVLTSGDGAGVGKIFHHFTGKLEFHQRVYLYFAFKSVLGRFFYYYLREHLARVVLAGNAKSTVDSLRRPMLLDFPVVVPPVYEQRTIVAELDRIESHTVDVCRKVMNQIGILREYRQALITAAVTGKLDVMTAEEPTQKKRGAQQMELELA
jgi:type I restriction enzyme S subunit